MGVRQHYRMLMAACGVACWALAASAQSAFAPVITVNEAAITGFEIDQRVRLMQATSIPGDLNQMARDALIDERLQMAAATDAGIVLPDTAIQTEMEAFAGRGKVSLEDFRKVLERNGVEFSSFEQFIRVRTTWREYIRARFAGRVSVSDAEVDRAMALSGGGLRVLLSEIVLPVNDSNRAQTITFAEDLSRTLTSIAEFERAARRYSASASRADGGHIDWIDASQLPPNVSSILVGMSAGQVTPPLQLPQAIILFQLRALAETAPRRVPDAALDYMLLRLGGAGTTQTNDRLAKIVATTDTCIDLWGQAQGLAETALTRQSLAPAAIPSQIRAELDRLDPNEISTRLTSPDGREAWLVMLCGRSPVLPAEQSREDIAQRLRVQRIEQLAASYLSELRAAARIEGQ